MKKLEKLTLNEMQSELSVLTKNEKQQVAGGGQWVYFNGELTYMLDEITVEGSYGTTDTVNGVWQTSEAYESLTTVSSLSSFIYLPSGVGAFYANQLEGVYEDFYHELYQQGYDNNDTLRVVSETQVMSNGGIMEYQNYYNSNGTLVKRLTIGRGF